MGWGVECLSSIAGRGVYRKMELRKDEADLEAAGLAGGLVCRVMGYGCLN